MRPEHSLPAPVPYHTLALVALGGGVVLLLASVCAAVSFALAPLLVKTASLATSTFILSVAAVAFGYGIALLWVGRSLAQKRPGLPLRLPSPLVFIAVFVAALALGQIILTLNLAPAYFFPLWHVVASLGVPLAVLSYAARRLPPISARSMLAQFAWGGLVTIALSLVFELVIGGILAGLAFVGIVVVLGNERAARLWDAVQSGVTDLPRALQIIMQEPLAIFIIALAALVMFLIVVPLIEETLKATGPAALIARRRGGGAGLSKSEIVLWGLAAGAGYAFTENMFNAAGALQSRDSASIWAAGMLIRSGTTLMHMLATTTVVIGWYQALVNGKVMRLLLLLLAAIAAHAVWNSGAILFGSFASFGDASREVISISTFLLGVSLLLLSGLFVVFLIWLVRLVRWAKPPPVEIITPQDMERLTPGEIREI